MVLTHGRYSINNQYSNKQRVLREAGWGYFPALSHSGEGVRRKAQGVMKDQEELEGLVTPMEDRKWKPGGGGTYIQGAHCQMPEVRNETYPGN
jgi:hypothetical protein